MTKNIVLACITCFILTLAASAQVPILPCVKQDGSPAPAGSITLKIEPGGQTIFTVSMPVAGNCHIEFDSYDDRSDAKRTMTDAASRITRLEDHAKGDIELMFLTWPNLRLYQSHRSYSAWWSSKREIEDKCDVSLDAGIWYLVVNNRFSSADKSVTLSIGKGKYLAPNFAPTKPETSTTQRNYSDSDDPPPKLKRQ